jgi:tRNA (guanine37-N1)-methyltransferase
VHIDILTLFPGMFDGPFGSSIIKRAVEARLLSVAVHNIRDYAHDRHAVVDDYPFGGGAGMVLKPGPVFEAVEAVRPSGAPVVLLTPQGRLFSQAVARELSGHETIVLICGRYEGVDERVAEHLATDQISIGDYVLSGGEPAAIVVVDAVARLIPGALGSGESLAEDSHTGGLLEYPQYTRPAVYREWAVPEVLMSGHHGRVAGWRREQQVRRTFERRPELLEKVKLTTTERLLVEQLSNQ